MNGGSASFRCDEPGCNLTIASVLRVPASAATAWLLETRAYGAGDKDEK